MQLVLQGLDAQPQSLCPTKLFASLDAEPGAFTNDQRTAARLHSAGMPAATLIHTFVVTYCTHMHQGKRISFAEWPCSLVV